MHVTYYLLETFLFDVWRICCFERQHCQFENENAVDERREYIIHESYVKYIIYIFTKLIDSRNMYMYVYFAKEQFEDV